MQTRFYIERRNDEAGNLLLKERPVFLSVAFHGDRLMFGTGIKTDFNGWDPDIQRMKSSYPGSYSTNAWLDTLDDTAQKAWATLEGAPEKPDIERFRAVFKELKPNFSTAYFDVFFLFLEAGSSTWATSTYRKVRTIYRHLREFEEQTEIKLSFRNMDLKFLRDFENFYQQKGNSKATTYKAVNIIVWFLNWATEKQYNANLEYRRFYKSLDKMPVEPREPLYLDWDELVLLSEFPCSSRRLGRVRDLFWFMCYSGLKFTELQNLKKEELTQNEVIIRKPSGKVRRIPLNSRSKQIHLAYENRYYLDNAAFPGMTIITMNKYLRILGKEAGLNRRVPAPGDLMEKVHLHERLTAGIAVHTFVANAIILEIPAVIIATFTGIQNSSRVKRMMMDLAKCEMEKLKP